MNARLLLMLVVLLTTKKGNIWINLSDEEIDCQMTVYCYGGKAYKTNYTSSNVFLRS